MISTSNIEWTDATRNPVRGCTKVIPADVPAMEREIDVLEYELNGLANGKIVEAEGTGK